MITIQEGKTLGSSRGEDSRILIKKQKKTKPHNYSTVTIKRDLREISTKCNVKILVSLLLKQTSCLKKKKKNGKKWGKMEIK